MPALKIGQLSKLTGVNIETIRYYEKIGLLEKANRGVNMYRSFSTASIEQLNFIITCRSLGFTLHEIQELNQLRKNPNQSCAVADHLVQIHLTQVAEKIQQLQEIQALLQQMSGCQQDSINSCKVIDSLQTH